MPKNSISQNVRVLQDVDKQGRERPWREKKLKSLKLAESYERLEKMGYIEDGKATKVRQCGGYLVFKQCQNGHKRLVLGYFCQTRLCPMCAWRRSRLIFANLMRVIHKAQEERNFSLITLTLTAKNVDSRTIGEELDRYFEAWKRMSERKAFRDAVIGWFRALEIKHDMTRDSYHPHFHCLLAVKPSYFRSKHYLDKWDWVYLWKEAMRLDYDPNVWVEKVKAKRGRKSSKPIDPEKAMEKAVAEVAKYFTKDDDYISDDELGTDLAVLTLDKAIKNRRLIAYGGIFREARRKLKLEDEETADLIRLGDEENEPEDACTCSICNSKLEEVFYRWNVGLSHYVEE